MFSWDGSLGLPALFLSSFLSATLLPGNSEIVLALFVREAPAGMWPALVCATAGNTLGGMTSYVLGRILPRHPTGRSLEWLRRFGEPLLLLAWVPFVGDALCVAAGWLRLNGLAVLSYMAVGKFLRYWLFAKGTLSLSNL